VVLVMVAIYIAYVAWPRPTQAGILQMPNLKRYFGIKVQYQNALGDNFEENIIGPKAAVLQQEIDHLNGVLISDY